MNYTYTLKSHTDIGFSNFFDTFRDEYNELYHQSRSERRQYIDNKLSEFNASTSMNDGELIFKSEADFTWFLLRWS